MKIDQKKLSKLYLIALNTFVGLLVVSAIFGSNNKVEAKGLNSMTFFEESLNFMKDAKKEVDAIIAEEIRKASIVYDGMTMDELADKLERSMNSDLDGKGRLFATYSIELGLDPYLALAIVLHETGCSYSCSGLLQSHNNLGGLKGGDGYYMSFPTLDDGIKGFLDILYDRYYSQGLTTPELMNPVYAESTTWASKINWYIEQIKAN